MAVGCFLHLESLIERCSQLLPLLPHDNTLVVDELAAIHHLVCLQLVPQPLHEAPHVPAQVELLIRLETGPRHQAEMFACRNVERFLRSRVIGRNHRVSTIEASQWEDQVHVCINGPHVPYRGTIKHSIQSVVEHMSESREKGQSPSCPCVFGCSEHTDRTIVTHRTWHTAQDPHGFQCKVATISWLREILVKPVLRRHRELVIDAVLRGVTTAAEKDLGWESRPGWHAFKSLSSRDPHQLTIYLQE